MTLIYTFYSRKDSKMSLEETKEWLKQTDKPIKYTHGFLWKNPTIKRVPVTIEKALELMEESYVDVDEYEDYIHISTFSSNDLF